MNDPHMMIKLLRAMAGGEMFKDQAPILTAAADMLNSTIVARAALKPFAEYAEQQAKAWGQHDNSAYYGIKRPGAVQVKYGDFRTAMAVYIGLGYIGFKEKQSAAMRELVANFVYECVMWAQHGANEGMISTKSVGEMQAGDNTISTAAGGLEVIDQDPADILVRFWEATGRVTEFEDTAQVVKDMILKGEF